MKFLSRLLIILFTFVIFSCDTTTQYQNEEEQELHNDLGELKLSELKEQSLTFFDNQAYSDQPVVRQVEGLMNELSDTYEGFGGLWFDPNEEDVIVIALTKEGDYAANQENIMSELQSTITTRFPESDLKFSITEVEYSFRELQGFRDLLIPVIHKRDDIVESFIDIEKNLFSIGLMEDANRIEYNRLLDIYSIPESATSFFETKPVELSLTTLRDYYRPLAGGLQIQNPSGGICTFGFNIQLDGIDMWVTNSHCTNQYSNNDNTQFHQNRNIYLPFVGIEFRDFEGFHPPGWDKYRYSDAALIEKNLGILSNFGTIARTEFSSTGWGSDGSLVIDEDDSTYPNPYFEIISDDREILVNMSIDKVGRTTGWTYGAVESTCTNVSNIAEHPGWTLICQIRSTIYTAGGDSGSPVFLWEPLSYPPAVDLVGIHWGNNTSRGVSFHSNIAGIRVDLVQSGETMTTY